MHTLTFSRNLAHKAVSSEDSFQELMPGNLLFFSIIFGMMELLATLSTSPFMLELLRPELFGGKLSSTKLTHHDDLVTNVPGDWSAKND